MKIIIYDYYVKKAAIFFKQAQLKTKDEKRSNINHLESYFRYRIIHKQWCFEFTYFIPANVFIQIISLIEEDFSFFIKFKVITKCYQTSNFIHFETTIQSNFQEYLILALILFYDIYLQQHLYHQYFKKYDKPDQMALVK